MKLAKEEAEKKDAELKAEKEAARKRDALAAMTSVVILSG